LTEIELLARFVARRVQVACCWPLYLSLVSELSGNSFVSQKLLGVIQKRIWAQVRQSKVLPVVEFFEPSWRVVLVGVREVEGVCLIVQGEHRVWVKVDDVERRVFADECGCRPNDEVHADGLVVGD
jgi:hypothetical protein